ncbi:MAG TPA: hypothetical protein VN887_06985, partial [Candidatus Angelobacter sp.]|nr:hypothetical protein [Candidatus Angelobacter sp.]
VFQAADFCIASVCKPFGLNKTVMQYATNGRILEADYNSNPSKPLGPHLSRAFCHHASHYECY